MMSRPILFVILFVFASPSLTAQETPAAVRRSYKPSHEFLQHEDAKCFKITIKEADRAFSKGYWDDAGKLYRAAKNCIDADQDDRSFINTRIEACRKAAEDELLAEQQKAIRQARQQEASNRANDAERLLRRFDRAKAFRLADFSNEYIAPPKENNPDCIQVMLDAWNYDPRIHSAYESVEDNLVVPFGYELAYNMGNNVHLRFGIIEDQMRLYAFAPERGALYSWILPDFIARKPQYVDSTLVGFDLSPDGVTRVFYTANTITLWRSARKTYNIDLPKVDLYCFDENGAHFYYFNTDDSSIYVVNVDEAFAPQAGGRSKGVKRINFSPKILVSNISPVPIALAADKDELWFGYADSIIVCNNQGTNRRVLPMIKPAKSEFGGFTSILRLFPAKGLAYFSDGLHTSCLQADEGRSGLSLLSEFDSQPIGFTTQGSLSVYQIENTFTSDKRIAIWGPSKSGRRYGFNVEDEDYFTALSGSFAQPKNKESAPAWFGAVSTAGVLKIWDLAGWGAAEDQLKNGVPLAFHPAKDIIAYVQGKHLVFANHQGKRLCQTPSFLVGEPDKILAIPPQIQINQQGWAAAAQFGLDSIALFHVERPEQVYWLPLPYSAEAVMAFDLSGKYFAFTTEEDSVQIYRIDSPTPSFVKGLRYGIYIGSMTFLGDEGRLVIQGVGQGDEGDPSSTIPKIWHFTEPGTRINPIRLEQYYANIMVANPGSDELILSNGSDARIFSTDDLLDESGSIRTRQRKLIGAIAFHPDGKTMAVGYNDGSIAFCDAHSGKQLFQIGTIPGQNLLGIRAIAYSDSTRRISVINENREVRSYDIDPNLIRRQVEGKGRQLVAFSPTQIGQWDLDKALNYDKNFKKLADSKDAPLIRSFFEFFTFQAGQSNNIKEMKGHVDRAYQLFNSLDSATQVAQTEVLFQMFDNYLWKLLLRNKVSDVEQVTRQLNERFKSEPIQLLKIKGHSALLRNNFRSAARYYTDWFMQVRREGYWDIYTSGEQQLLKELLQMYDYNLLNTQQRNLAAGLFVHKYNLPEPFVKGTDYAFRVQKSAKSPLKEDFTNLPIDPDTRLIWQIFNALDGIPYSGTYEVQIEYLKEVLALATKLKTSYPEIGTPAYQETSIQLANVYKTWGEFEQGNLHSLEYYQNAIEVLSANTGFVGKLEQYRLDTLAALYLQGGNILLPNQPDSALAWYRKGLDYGRRLQKTFDNPVQINAVANRVTGPILTQIGLASLLRGRVTEAEDAFGEADEVLTKGLNTLYNGHVALLEGDETAALLEYGGISNNEQLSLAVSELNMIADQQPARAEQLRNFAARIQKGLSAQPWYNADEADYLLADKLMIQANDKRRWKESIRQSERAIIASESWLQKRRANYTDLGFWQKRYLDARLNYSYYILFDSKSDTTQLRKSVENSVDLLKKAEQYSYDYWDLFYTNIGHAYLLLNESSRAVDYYRQYLNINGSGALHPMTVLEKDWRDLQEAGIVLPGLDEVRRKIAPPAQQRMEK